MFAGRVIITYKNLVICTTVGFLAFIGLGGIVEKTVSAEPYVQRTTAKMIKSNGQTNLYFKFQKPYRARLILHKTTGNYIKKTLTLPKGTIVSGVPDRDGHKFTTIHNGAVDVSYQLKKRVVKGYQSATLNFAVKYSSGILRQVKKPAYSLPYGHNILWTGKPVNLWPKRAVTSPSQIKITSDGYVEFYRYHSVTAGDTTINYQVKPNSSVKINHVLKRGSSMYFYYRDHLKGVSDKRVRKAGPYQYRLTLTNKNTPYAFGDPDNDMFQYASFYSVGNRSYWTVDGVSDVYDPATGTD